LASEEKVDPIQETYFTPLEWADRGSDLLFYASTILASSALVLTKCHSEDAASAVTTLFISVAVVSFALSLTIRLYFAPRAEDCRRSDMASNAFGAPLQPDLTERYYNNDESPSFRRLAGILAENSFFSKSVAQRMCSGERLKTTVSVVLLVLLSIFRGTGIDWVVVAAQFVASEQVVSKCIRLEWLRSRFEHTYQDTFALLTMADPEGAAFKAKTLALALNYEASKANAAVLLSKKVFNQMNAKLTQEWNVEHKPKLHLT
jgi:hypothetical protein